MCARVKYSNEDTTRGIRGILTDLSMAILIIANSIAWIIPISGYNLVFVMALSGVLFLIGDGLKFFNTKPFIIIIPSLLLFVLSILFRTGPDEYLNKYLLEFIALGITSLFMAFGRFNPIRVLKIICYISIPMLIYVKGIDMYGGVRVDYGFWMGISYGIVKYIVALVLLIFFTKEFPMIIRLALLFVFALYMIFYLEFSSRGALLAVVFSIGLFWIVRQDYTLTKTGIISIAILIFGYFYIMSIFEILYTYLQSIGIESTALHKLLYLNDITNGREDIAVSAYELFLNSPIWGNGIASYEELYDRYVHNCFIQFLDEGGILYLLLMTYFIAKSFIILFDKKISQSQRYFMAFLISCGLIQLLFSSYFWGAQCFWLMIGYSMKITHKKTHFVFHK